MDEREIRLRCIEAAAKNPTPHPEGYASGVLQSAQKWAGWVLENQAAHKPGTITLKKP
jgi:hypothetical protein